MNTLTKVSLISVLAVVATFSAIKFSRADTCGTGSLSGSILSDGSAGGGALAIVSNSSDCSANVSFRAIQVSNGVIYDSQTAVVGPFQSLELHINVPTCQYNLSLASDAGSLDSRTVGGNSCTTTTSCTSGGTVIINDNLSAGWHATRPDGSVYNGTGAGTFSGPQITPGVYSVSADDVAGYTKTVSGGGTLSCGGTLSFTITYTPVQQTCTAGTITVNSNSQYVDYFITPPSGSTFGWHGPHTFTGQPAGNYLIRADDIAGYTKTLNATSGTLACGGNLGFTITFSGIATTPTPTPATTTTTSTPTPVATPTPATLIIPTPNPVSIIFNSQCANNATNSCNTTNTSTITTTTNNTSTISQNGNSNVAGVNQAGAINPTSTAGNYNGTPGQLILPTGNSAYQSNIGLVNFSNPTPTPYPVYYQPLPVIYPTPYPVYQQIAYAPTQTLSIQKYGRNISQGGNTNQTSLTARPGDTLEFDVVVMAPANTNLNNVIISDNLPSGLNYVSNTTSLNGIITNDGITYNGLNIGTLYAGQQATIKFNATVSASAYSGQVFTNTSSARADNVSSMTSNPVTVRVANSVIAGALQVRTGPTSDVFSLAGLGGLLSSAFYMVRRKGLGTLIRLS